MKSDRIIPEDLPAELSDSLTATPSVNDGMTEAGALLSLEKLGQAHVRKILARTPSLKAAAEILDIDQATLYRKRKAMGTELTY